MLKQCLILSVCLLCLVSGPAMAAATLHYQTSGDNLIVTAADGARECWQMTFQVSGTRQGRLMAFYDLSGNSDPEFNYAHSDSSGSGMFDPMDGGNMREAGRWTLSNLSQQDSAFGFTLSRTATQATTGGTAVYSMNWSVSAPTTAVGGYNAAIVVNNTFSYDALWWESSLVKGTAIAAPSLRLWSAVGYEYAFATSTDKDANLQTAKLTATGEDDRMAESSYFLLTSQWDQSAGSYSGLLTGYASQSTLYAYGNMENDISGLNYGSAGPDGLARQFSSVTTLNINVIPEPATIGLLTVGLAGLIANRRRRRRQ